ncbi:prolyl oligopeptidase family serine peptidase [Actinocorallia lasiicapitis]
MPSDVSKYPTARRETRSEIIHGRAIRDPYRWLEDPLSEETQEWCSRQDEITRRHLDALPDRAHWKSMIENLVAIGVTGPPVWCGDRYFFMRRCAGDEHPVLYVKEPDGSERKILDPMELDPTGRTTLDSWYPDPTGRRLAFRCSEANGRRNVLYVIDLESGKVLDGPTHRCNGSAVAWLPNGDAFYHVRGAPLGDSSSGDRQLHQRVFLHRIGTDYDREDIVVFSGSSDIGDDARYTADLSGNMLTVTAVYGQGRWNDLWAADLGQSDPENPRFLAVQQGREGKTQVIPNHSGKLYLLTDAGAPRRRLLFADALEAASWSELIPEDTEATLDHIAVVDASATDLPVIIAGWSRGGISEISIHDLSTGEEIGTIPTPSRGTVGEIRSAGQSVWFTYTDFVTPVTVYRWDVTTGRTTLWAAPPGTTPSYAAQRIAVHPLSSTSRDGTTVEVTLVAPSGPVIPRALLLNCYGGFGLSSVPLYSPEIIAWVEAGGAFAIAHVRGGGEKGAKWHQDGIRSAKQKSIEDLHSVAETLIADGWTTAERLVVDGESNGGMLVSAAVVQRPELFRAAICSNPLTDMIRYEQFGLGSLWTREYGSASLKEELEWLIGYSPYHNVTENVKYPAVLFTASEADSVVDPMHSRKMCAILQHATQNSGRGRQRPVYLRRDAGTGHGSRSMSKVTNLLADQLSFAAFHAGLTN